MISLKEKEINLYQRQKSSHMCKEMFCYDNNKKSESALYHKVRYHCHYTKNLEELLIIFAISDTKYLKKFL